MKAIYFLIICLFIPSLASSSTGEGLAEGLVNPGYVEKPDWFKTSFLDINEDVDEATDAGKGLILYFFQDGCPYCEKLIKDNFHDAEIVAKTRKNFDLIAINLWGDTEVIDFKQQATTEKQFSVDLNVMFTPTLLFVDSTGKVLLRMNGYFPKQRFSKALDYVASKQFADISFNQYIAAISRQGSLHREADFMQPPYLLPAQQRDSEKLLAVIFEEGDCAACDELHQDILKRQETKKALQPYDMVQLDMHSDTPVMTPAGDKLTASQWASRLNIQYAPSIVFFDKNNQEVFRTEAYLKTFHTVAALRYVSEGIYLKEPEFQRFVQDIADTMREHGLEVDIMK